MENSDEEKTVVSNNMNLIKTRNDYEFVRFEKDPESKAFKLSENEECSWAKPDDTFDSNVLRERIEPWLTALFQSEHLSLLLGSGLTHGIHQIAFKKPAGGMQPRIFSTYPEEIQDKAAESAIKAGRKEGNIEDQLRVANELLRGLEILKSKDAAVLKDEIQNVLADFATSVLNNEKEIAESTKENRNEALNVLMNFLLSFASRTGSRDRLNIFTTNYDRLIELGAELAGLHLLDRFVGNLTPIFRSSRLDLDMHYNPPGIRGEPRYLEGVSRFTKLHGSVDWIQVGSEIRRVGVPFGTDSIQPFLNAPGLYGANELQLMIYPNSAKDRETAQYPYVDLFRDFASAICNPNSTLVCYGYSFGDEHINRMIEDMLTIPSTHLVIIAFNDPLGRVEKIYEKIGRPSQITLLIGPDLADIKELTQKYLPKAAIDKASLRMSELLQKRFNCKEKEESAKIADKEGGER